MTRIQGCNIIHGSFVVAEDLGFLLPKLTQVLGKVVREGIVVTYHNNHIGQIPF